MALIYRAIFEVDDPSATFVEAAGLHACEWLRWKLDDAAFELPVEGTVELPDRGIEISSQAGADEECGVRRIAVFEGARDDGAQVKTTLTALRDARTSWAWIDLERWTGDDRSTAWVPTAPGVVSRLLLKETARLGTLELVGAARVVSGDEGRVVAREVLDSGRGAPIVVVSYNRGESDGVRVAEERGRELAKRLAGIATVVVLGEGAVSSFSRGMLDGVGEDMDVHSGAVRTYLPGAARDDDYPGRHRFVSFRKLEGRRAELAALIVAPQLFRRAVEVPPPPVWRSRARSLLVRDLGHDEYDQLLGAADSEIAALASKAAGLEAQLDAERESVVALARSVDDLGRRNRHLRDELRKRDPSAAILPAPDDFEPLFCSEVVEHALKTLHHIVIHVDVIKGARELDEHADESWARKAWLSLRALQEYAEAKAAGDIDCDFKTCCEQSATDVVVPAGWVARTETKQTMASQRFRELRRLPVSPDVDPSGRVVMEEHSKIEMGGTPCPRIHYYDDTRGSTGRIHVGWFGDHLDSHAKS